MTYTKINDRAKGIAADANECCNRSDGWEEHIAKLAKVQIEEAIEDVIKLIEGGRFLHERAPPKLFATEVVTAIREEFLA